MSLHLEFEPHSWYRGFAIRDCRHELIEETGETAGVWNAITDDGNTYRIIDIEAKTLRELKQRIRQYHLDKHTGYGERIAKRRLEYLRGEIQAERISYGEICELESLADYIAPDDTELRQWTNKAEKGE